MPAAPKPASLAEAFAAVAEAQKANDAASAAWLAAVADGDRIAFAPETKAALAAARDAVPIPAALIVPPSTVRTILVHQQADGSEETHNIDHRPWLPKCPADVHAHCAGDKAKRDEMLAALRDYQGAVATAEAKAVPALAKARRAERKLDRAADVAREKLQVAADRLARVPASTPEEALAKVTAVLHAYGSGLDRRGNVITGMKVDLPEEAPAELLGSLMADLRRMATAPQPQPPTISVASPDLDPVVRHLALADAETANLGPADPLTDRYFELLDGELEGDATSLLGLAWRVARVAGLRDTLAEHSDEDENVAFSIRKFDEEIESIMRSLVAMGANPTPAIRATFNIERVPFTPCEPSPAETHWRSVAAAYSHALAEREAIYSAYSAAIDEVDEAAPTPALLDLGEGRSLFSEEHIQNAPVPEAVRVTMREELARWKAAEAAAWALTPFKRGNAEDEPGGVMYEADSRFYDAFDQMLEAPAPSIDAMVFKFRAVIERVWCDRLGDDVDSPETFTRFLSEQSLDGGMPAAWLYLDALRLSGQKSALLETQPFDGDAWIAQFEANPGHRITPRGAEYQEPYAWGPETPTRDQLRITDPEAIARYEAHVRSRHTEEEWERRTYRVEPGTPVHLQQIEAISWAYPDGGPEHDRLIDLWERHLAVFQRPPTAAHLWRDLPDWRRDIVLTCAKKRDRQAKAAGNGSHESEQHGEEAAVLVAA